MSKEKLIFCPLGGSGEIGGNMNLYAYGENDNQKWIIVDMGVSFADDSVPGVDLIMPDAGFIIETKGLRTPVFSMRFKLFLKYLHDSDQKLDVYIPSNQKEVNATIESILSRGTFKNKKK